MGFTLVIYQESLHDARPAKYKNSSRCCCGHCLKELSFNNLTVIVHRLRHGAFRKLSTFRRNLLPVWRQQVLSRRDRMVSQRWTSLLPPWKPHIPCSYNVQSGPEVSVVTEMWVGQRVFEGRNFFRPFRPRGPPILMQCVTGAVAPSDETVGA